MANKTPSTTGDADTKGWAVPPTPYPHVMDEMTTLGCVLAGASLARYGDGEIRLCLGYPAKAQRFERDLTRRLQQILRGEFMPTDVLVGIPNLNSATPKMPFWDQYREMTRPFLVEREYVSSFVTRPDSAPWIDTPEYWTLVESLWRDRDVVVVRGGRHGLDAADLATARSVRVVTAPERDAWSEYRRIVDEVAQTAPGRSRCDGIRVLLCLGPTATVMACDLAARGAHAIDIGHLAMFLRKHRNGEPMIRTEADKVP